MIVLNLRVKNIKLFRKKSDIAIIPGVEMDVFLTQEDKEPKHIIFYFDDKELDYIDELKLLVESYIENHSFLIMPHYNGENEDGFNMKEFY